MYYVYILYSESRQRYYTGSAADVAERLLHHNGGYNRSTKTGRPWTLVKTIEVNDRTAALKLENRIKSRGAGRYLREL